MSSEEYVHGLDMNHNSISPLSLPPIQSFSSSMRSSRVNQSPIVPESEMEVDSEPEPIDMTMSSRGAQLTLMKPMKTEDVFNQYCGEKEPNLISWKNSHPCEWSSNQVLDFIYFIAEERNAIRGICGEKFQKVNGEKLLKMQLHDLQKLEPELGQAIYDEIREHKTKCESTLDTFPEDLSITSVYTELTNYADISGLPLDVLRNNEISEDPGLKHCLTVLHPNHLNNYQTSSGYPQSTPLIIPPPQQQPEFEAHGLDVCVVPQADTPLQYDYEANDRFEEVSDDSAYDSAGSSPQAESVLYTMSHPQVPTMVLDNQGDLPVIGEEQHINNKSSSFPGFGSLQCTSLESLPGNKPHAAPMMHHNVKLEVDQTPAVPKRRPVGRPPRARNPSDSSENSDVPRVKSTRGRKPGQLSKGNHLWEFIRDLLKDPQYNPHVIKWEDAQEGVFRIVKSVEVSKLWGKRKSNPGMNYEKLSRAMRDYYKVDILDMKATKGIRLTYKFGHKAKW